MAKQMFTRMSFLHGMKPTYDPSSIPEDAVWNVRNIRPDMSGVLRIRPGSQSINDSLGTGAVQSVSDSFDGFLTVFGQDLYLIDDDGVSTTIDSSGSLGADSSTPITAIQSSSSGTEMVYFFTGSGLYETDGSTLSLVTPADEAENLLNDGGSQDTTSGIAKSHLAVIQTDLSQRYVCAGFSDSPNTVYFSEVMDITDWRSDRTLQLPDDGGVITGLVNWYDALVIFRDKDIWAFFGDISSTDSVLTLQDKSVGCKYHRTIAPVPDMGLVFLGEDSVYVLQNVEAISSQVVARPIGDDIRNFLIDSIKEDSKPCAVYHNRDYILSFPNASEKVYRLSLQNEGGWFMDSGPSTSQFVIRNGNLYGAGKTKGVIRHISKDYLTDDGNRIAVLISFRRDSLLPGPSRIRRIFVYVSAKGRKETSEEVFQPLYDDQPFDDELYTREVEMLTGTEQHFKVTALVDGNVFDITDFLVEAERVESTLLALVDPVKIYEARFMPSLKGHYVQIRIESTHTNEDISILGYGIEYSTKGRLRGTREGVTE